MTVQEVRKIREKKSVEWINVTAEKRNEEIKNGAKEIQRRIEEMKNMVKA